MEENLIQVNDGIMININLIVKNVMCVKKITYNCENGKYLASIMNDSAIICDEVIYADENTKSNNVPNFTEKKATCKTPNIYTCKIYIALLIAVSIYFYLIKD